MFFSAEFFIKFWLQIMDLHVENQIVWVIKLLSITPFFMALISVYCVNGIVVGKDKLMVYIVLITIVVGLYFGVFFIPKYTYIGAFFILLVSHSFYSIGSSVILKKQYLIFQIQENDFIY